MLTLLNPSPKLPGKDIDMFLQPLIEELKELWTIGVRLRDGADNNEVFQLRVALLWKINDFPARDSLSGWSGLGYLACPTWATDMPTLPIRNRVVYYYHRRYLPDSHRMRKCNGHDKNRVAKKRSPKRVTVGQIIEHLNNFPNMTPGKHSRGPKRARRERTNLEQEKHLLWVSILVRVDIEAQLGCDAHREECVQKFTWDIAQHWREG